MRQLRVTKHDQTTYVQVVHQTGVISQLTDANTDLIIKMNDAVACFALIDQAYYNLNE